MISKTGFGTAVHRQSGGSGQGPSGTAGTAMRKTNVSGTADRSGWVTGEGSFELRRGVQAQEGIAGGKGPLSVRKTGPSGRAERTAAPPAGPKAAPSVLRGMVDQVLRDEERMERMMRKAIRGRIKNVEELISLQVTVYRYTQQAEMLSKVVDRATQAIKQTLQTPV